MKRLLAAMRVVYARANVPIMTIIVCDEKQSIRHAVFLFCSYTEQQPDVVSLRFMPCTLCLINILFMVEISEFITFSIRR
jgi:hypothetical protein